jgi:hypothetical protein
LEERNGKVIIHPCHSITSLGFGCEASKAAYNFNPSFNVANADVNGDGVINAADVTLLREYISAGGARGPVKLGPPPGYNGQSFSPPSPAAQTHGTPKAR